MEKSRNYWQETWHRFAKNRINLFALGFIVFLSLIALFSPMLAGTKPIVCKYKGKIYFPMMGYYYSNWENPIFMHDGFGGVYPENLKKNDEKSWAVWPLIYNDPYRRVRDNEWPGRPGNHFGKNSAPCWQHPMGTTSQGYDVLTVMIHGTKIALLVGFVSTGIAALIGIVVGAIAGYFGGWTDIVISRAIEIVMCIPSLILILALISIVEKPTIWHIMAILGVTGWTGIARLTRAEFLKLKQSEYVAAAKALGASQTRIIFRHILPNSLAPILVPITFGIAAAILVESGLSFLGFGAPAPNPSWGMLLNAGRSNLSYWWLSFFPGLAIFLTVLTYNLIGEGLQEATDPRLRS